MHSRTSFASRDFFGEATVPEGRHDESTCVVFVHGLGGNSMIHYALQEVVAEQVPTVSLDLLGLGRSSEVCPRSFNDWVKQVGTAVEEAGPFRHLVLVGHSLGTLVARHVAAVDPRVVAQILFAPIPAAVDEAQRTVMTARADAAVTYGMVAVADQFGITTLSPVTRRDDLVTVAVVRDLLMGQDAAAYATCCKVLSQASEAPAPENPECYTLLVRGIDDSVSSHTAVSAVQDALRPTMSRTVVLDDVGHWPQLEDPGRCRSLAWEHIARRLGLKLTN